MLRLCPICRSKGCHVEVEPGEMAKEIRTRSRFVRHRIPYRPTNAELMDLTRFAHGGIGFLATCPHCGHSTRVEPDPFDYSVDVYDHDLLAHLYPRYLQAFAKKEGQYRDLLRPHADVLELGSHLGAFLETAEGWGWRPIGLDIGESTSQFARHRGLSVLPTPLEQARIGPHSQDAIFVWNCFEQMEDPAATLHAAHRILKPHGLLVVRAPNVAYYRQERERWLLGNREALRSLAHQNLLAFPYLTGYTPLTLADLLARHGFEVLAGFDASVLTVPYAEAKRPLRREIRRAHRSYEYTPARAPQNLEGPWVELLCRRAAS